jgi:hypothetical protein
MSYAGLATTLLRPPRKIRSVSIIHTFGVHSTLFHAISQFSKHRDCELAQVLILDGRESLWTGTIGQTS